MSGEEEFSSAQPFDYFIDGEAEEEDEIKCTQEEKEENEEEMLSLTEMIALFVGYWIDFAKHTIEVKDKKEKENGWKHIKNVLATMMCRDGFAKRILKWADNNTSFGLIRYFRQIPEYTSLLNRWWDTLDSVPYWVEMRSIKRPIWVVATQLTNFLFNCVESYDKVDLSFLNEYLYSFALVSKRPCKTSDHFVVHIGTRYPLKTKTGVNAGPPIIVRSIVHNHNMYIAPTLRFVLTYGPNSHVPDAEELDQLYVNPLIMESADKKRKYEEAQDLVDFSVESRKKRARTMNSSKKIKQEE